MTNYIDTYYARTLPETAQSYSTLTADLQTDVCVIGGGLAGLNTALGLLERGQRAVIVEAKRIGWGGSGRNGGFVAKGYAASEMDLLKKLGKEPAQKLVGLTKMGRKLIRQRIDEFNIDCGPIKDGVLTVSWRDEPLKVQAYIKQVNETFDLGFEFWPREKVRTQLKTETYFDGIFSPQDFQFMPLRYVHGIAREIVKKGGEIYEDTAAFRIEKDLNGWRIYTPGGTIRAKQVVLCCSIYIDGLDKRLENASFSVRTFVMVTKPVDPNILKTAIDTPHAVYDNRFCSDYYRLLPENRILWGGRVALWADPSEIAPLLLSDMLKVYPQLKDHVQADTAWAGELCYAPHKMPQIGMIEPGYWYNTGFGGHGLAPTTVGGELIASAIAEGDERYKMFAPFGIGYAGGKMGRYVAQMVYGWWRARDYLNF